MRANPNQLAGGGRPQPVREHRAQQKRGLFGCSRCAALSFHGGRPPPCETQAAARGLSLSHSRDPPPSSPAPWPHPPPSPCRRRPATRQPLPTRRWASPPVISSWCCTNTWVPALIPSAAQQQQRQAPAGHSQPTLPMAAACPARHPRRRACRPKPSALAGERPQAAAHAIMTRCCACVLDGTGRDRRPRRAMGPARALGRLGRAAAQRAWTRCVSV